MVKILKVVKIFVYFRLTKTIFCAIKDSVNM